MHAMLASIVQNPTLMLSAEESENLAKGIVNVARHYDASGMSAKTIDWVNLIMVAGAIYGTRFVTWRRMRQDGQMQAEPPVNPNQPLVNGSMVTQVH